MALKKILRDDVMTQNRNVILIVDDMKVNRMILFDIVRDEYEVIQAKDGVEAIQMIQENRESLALILLDIMMPLKNGYEVLAEMREMNLINVIPVIVVTVLDRMEGESKALELGAIDVILKPIEPVLLKRRIQNVISAHQYNRMVSVMRDSKLPDVEVVNQEVMALSDRLLAFKKENEFLKRLVKLDQLTGVYTRNVIQQMVTEYFADGREGEYGFILIQFCNLDFIYEHYGVLRGDSLMQNFGQTIKALFRGNDLIGRVDNDCFAVVTNDYGGGDYLRQKAQHIMEAMKNFEAELDNGDSVCVGIGAAIYPKNGSTFEELFVTAQKMLNSGKWNKNKGAKLHSFFMLEDDTIVDIMSSNEFFDSVHRLLEHNYDKQYLFIRINLSDFDRYSELQGYLESEKLLAYVGDEIGQFVGDKGIYGKIYTDTFGICMVSTPDEINRFVNMLEIKLYQFETEVEITPYCGVYKIDKKSSTEVEMCNYAGLACQKAKRVGDKRVEFYHS